MFSVKWRKIGGGGYARLDLIYFALAAFDLLTICLALYLNHMANSAFEEGVRVSAAWSARQAEIIRLARLVQAVDAPGNDVFYTHSVTHEQRAFEEALVELNREWRKTIDNISRHPLSPRDSEVLRRLGLARHAADSMALESSIIFSEYKRGDIVSAGRGMALMDRTYATLSSRLDDTLAIVEAGRAEHLQTLFARARALRVFEILVAAALVVVVCLVALYGSNLGRVMRNAEAQRADMMKQLESARDRLRHYADDVSHELRGPISKMRLDAEVLLGQSRSPDQYRGGVEAILVECERLSSIVESLLFLARAGQLKLKSDAADLDLEKELGLIAEFFGAAAEEAGVRIRMQATKGVVKGDRALFQRAVSNLVSNAIKHSPQGGEVRLGAHIDGPEVVVTVEDDGPGIPPNEMERVFERFHRGANARGAAGLGLGLAIAKGVMEIHGGSIVLDSPPGMGVHAQLRFPASFPPAGEGERRVRVKSEL